MEYKYEVAFSLVNEDKEVARQINNLIKNKFPTFVYFENKDEVGAQNGLELFYNVFHNKAKIVVVLFSDKWGKTKWTHKEDLAIRNRAVENDWEFLIIVKLNNRVDTPGWYPKSEQWVNYEDYGINGVASVIENKVREFGGKVKNETIIEKAKRKASDKENLINIRAELEKEHVGIQMANDEKLNLFKICKDRIDSLNEAAKVFNFIIKIEDSDYIQVKAHPFVLNIHWWQESSNFLEGSHLEIQLKKKVKRGLMFEENYDQLYLYSYVFNINPSWQNGWSINDYTGEFSTSETLIDKWLNIILERMN